MIHSFKQAIAPIFATVVIHDQLRSEYERSYADYYPCHRLRHIDLLRFRVSINSGNLERSTTIATPQAAHCRERGAVGLLKRARQHRLSSNEYSERVQANGRSIFPATRERWRRWR
jgi:hypothetical protein